MAKRRRQPKQERSQALVDSIVEATLLLLSHEDAERPSVRAIAKRAGVGIGSIYDYFTTRDGIMEAVLARLTEDNFEDLRAVLDSCASVEESLLAVMDRLFEIYLDRPVLTRTAIRTIVTIGGTHAIVAERDRFVELVADRLADVTSEPREELLHRTTALADMMVGIVMAEVHRDPDSARTKAALRTMRRIVNREIASLTPRADVIGTKNTAMPPGGSSSEHDH